MYIKVGVTFCFLNLTAKRKSRVACPGVGNTHHVYRLMYHFIWFPKYRHKVFAEPYREVLKGIIHKAGYDYDIDIVELEIPEDRIHMVVRGVPKMSPSDVMQVIKNISAREFFRLYPEINERYFLGRKIMDSELLC